MHLYFLGRWLGGGVGTIATPSAMLKVGERPYSTGLGTYMAVQPGLSCSGCIWSQGTMHWWGIGFQGKKIWAGLTEGQRGRVLWQPSGQGLLWEYGVFVCDVSGYRVCGWGLIKAHSVESYPKIVFSRIYPKFCLANAWIQLSIWCWTAFCPIECNIFLACPFGDINLWPVS